MSEPSESNKTKISSLMERLKQLGCLLPAPDDFDTTDPRAVAEAKLVLAEMDKTEAEIEALQAEEVAEKGSG